MVMKDATPLTPPSAWAELFFQMKTTYNQGSILTIYYLLIESPDTIHDPWGPETYNYSMM